MTTITTIEQLDEVPVLTVLVDVDGDAWQKHADGWVLVGGRMPERAVELMAFAPFELDPALQVAPELYPTLCSGSDSCTATTPLTVGASWYCREHIGTTHDTTKEN